MHEEPPASPSTIAPQPPPPPPLLTTVTTQEEATESGTERPLPPPPTKEVDDGNAAAAAADTGALRHNPPSVCSSSIAARVRQAQLRAAEQLAEIKKREMELERDLIQQRLQVEMDTIMEESRVSLPAESVPERLKEWLDTTADPRCRVDENLERDRDIAPVVVQDRERDMKRNEARALETDRNRTFSVNPMETEARPVVDTQKGYGVENLAETLDRVLTRRPMPRYAQELPVFSGSPNEWLLFKAAVRDSTRLYKFTAEENLARLRVSLKGEAKESVSALLWSATDPDRIMTTLEQCYGRPEVLIDRALEDMKSLPRSGTSATELNTLAVKLQNIVCVIQAVDDRGYLRNPLLVREVVKKLSPHLLSNWVAYAEKSESSEPEIVILSRFLMKEADRELRYAYVPTTSQQRENFTIKNRSEKRTDKKKNVARIYNVGQKETPSVPCLVCGNDHEVPHCNKYKAMTVDERWQWARNNGVCFRCVNNKHRRFRCTHKLCGVNNCNARHHATLHKDRAASNEETLVRESQTETIATINRANVAAKVMLKVCPVTVKGPGGAVQTYALLDEGSTVTIVDQDLADEIGAKGPVSNLRICSINAQGSVANSEDVSLVLVARDESTHHVRAKTMTSLTLNHQTVSEDCLQYAHLRRLAASDVCYDRVKPRLLIGADNWHLIVSRKLLMGNKRQPVASLTKLGWVIHGTAPRIKALEGSSNIYKTELIAPEVELQDMVKRYFEIDALGIARRERENPMEVRAVKAFNESIKRVGGQCEVRLPWKRDDVTLPPSYYNAVKRLKSIERKMDRSSDFEKAYTTQIENLFTKGYAKQCSEKETDDPRAWYLPHFAVTNVNKPGKIRLVFDAAAKANDVCLNDELLEGPDLLQDLNGLLLRFREKRIAITADIQEMFLQVKIAPIDQPAQMFLWRGGDRDGPPRKYKMTSMIFGAKSSPFLAHSVRDWNARESADEYPLACQAITKNHYMDDWVDSFDDKERAINTMKQVIEVHRRAGFKLTGFNSNEARVLAELPLESRATSSPKQLGSNLDDCGRTLGLLWDAATDTLGFNTTLARVPAEVKALARPPTKREALSAVMSVFDPLGLLSYYTIRAKIVLQNIWKLNVEWDEALPESEAEEIIQWLRDIEKLRTLRLPRLYARTGGEPSRELHVFCDASEVAYATAAYWRVKHENGEVQVTLAAAKARVAPMKPLTVPRLELQAALIGARLASSIKRQQGWEPEKTVYWTDSRTVWHWIRNDSVRYTPYVAHRLGEIAETTDASQWRWVPTALNVADDATRPNVEMKTCNDRWFTGPKYLYEDEALWPKCDDVTEDTVEIVLTTMVEANDSVPRAERFSSYERLVRTMARVLLFVRKCRDRAATMNVELLEEAEMRLQRESQRQCFAEDIERLTVKRNLRAGSRLRKLDPYLDERGVLRARGRIGAAGVSAPATHPVVMDGRHPYARLLLYREHRRAHHAHNERVVNEVRAKYWILRLRPTIRTVASKCVFCRVRKARPVVPVHGDLPKARLQPFMRPFTNCGVDFFGPMTVTVGRRHEKRWGALFTCLTTRAIHIELVASLSTDSAIMALRRMGARRGWPRLMYSDNATNFRGADVELRRAIEEWEPALRDYALTERMDWRYIAPGAPHQGGAWERLVRSVKSALRVTLNEKSPREEVLATLLAEVEHTINARPLTHVPVSEEDPEALTPNHFLLGGSRGLPLTGPCEPASRKLWRAAQALADEYWRRWVREYLPQLIPRGGARDVAGRSLKPGDVVIIVDSSLPRNVWPRGVVTAVHPGPDGEIRNADVRTRGGVFRRPTARLAVLPTEEEGAASAAPGGDCYGQLQSSENSVKSA